MQLPMQVLYADPDNPLQFARQMASGLLSQHSSAESLFRRR